MLLPAARRARALVGAAISLTVLSGAGCIGSRIVYPVLTTAEERREFEEAGPLDLQVQDELLTTMQVQGPYRIVSGDLLTVELPSEVELEPTAADRPGLVTVKCRVKESGSVLLPMLGDRPVAGKTTAEVEEELAKAYHDPTRLKDPPNVVVTVGEYHTVSVAVLGAVNSPGLHDLRSDHRTVVGALMAAGGIRTDHGAREIKIITKDEQGAASVQSLGVHMNEVPLADVTLVGGETIVVEPPTDRAFTVIGLVKKSGLFVYPPPRRYNLMQALAVAGGVDESAAPRYATVYRVRADGSILGATFKIDGTSLQDASNVLIKDGDVIAVDHTQGSWLRSFFNQVLGFRASVNLTSTASPTL